MTTPVSSVTYNYDNADRLTSATHSKFGTVNFSYDDAGNITSMTYPNNIATTYYTYDKRNRVTNITYRNRYGSIISSVSYSYDDAGNRTSMTDEPGTTTYTYDTLNQLKTVTTPRRGVQEYAYDKAGDRTSYTDPWHNVSYTYDNANQLDYLIDNGVRTDFTYDANGNQTSKGDMTFTWDYQNRLVQVNNPRYPVPSTFAYDGDGKRISKTDSKGTRNYIYDGVDVVLETDGNGSLTREYFSLAGGIICKEEKLSSGITSKEYMLHDYLGSTIFVLDSEGNVLSNYYYEPFGECWNATSDPTGNIRFTGKEYEEDTGLYYFAARWYDAEIGRFVSQDPTEPLSYIYCFNNPMKYVDPSGLRPPPGAPQEEIDEYERMFPSDPVHPPPYTREMEDAEIEKLIMNLIKKWEDQGIKPGWILNLKEWWSKIPVEKQHACGWVQKEVMNILKGKYWRYYNFIEIDIVVQITKDFGFAHMFVIGMPLMPRYDIPEYALFIDPWLNRKNPVWHERLDPNWQPRWQPRGQSGYRY